MPFLHLWKSETSDLMNVPIAIAPKGKRGVITTCNYVARKYKVKAAMPTYQALNLCPKLLIIEPNFELYSKVSEYFYIFEKI